ncbi:MAG TPA: hypothetical protein VF647_24285 [Longimicrobium sp.]|jgi:hypothetical protein
MGKEQSRALIAGVDSVLREVWDPIGINGAPETRDEYTSYAPHIARLLRSGASDAEIERHLATLILGMGISWVSPDRARSTLAALRFPSRRSEQQSSCRSSTRKSPQFRRVGEVVVY